jgi:hypothetical protein
MPSSPSAHHRIMPSALRRPISALLLLALLVAAAPTANADFRPADRNTVRAAVERYCDPAASDAQRNEAFTTIWLADPRVANREVTRIIDRSDTPARAITLFARLRNTRMWRELRGTLDDAEPVADAALNALFHVAHPDDVESLVKQWLRLDDDDALRSRIARRLPDAPLSADALGALVRAAGKLDDSTWLAARIAALSAVRLPAPGENARAERDIDDIWREARRECEDNTSWHRLEGPSLFATADFNAQVTQTGGTLFDGTRTADADLQRYGPNILLRDGQTVTVDIPEELRKQDVTLVLWMKPGSDGGVNFGVTGELGSQSVDLDSGRLRLHVDDTESAELPYATDEWNELRLRVHRSVAGADPGDRFATFELGGRDIKGKRGSAHIRLGTEFRSIECRTRPGGRILIGGWSLIP